MNNTWKIPGETWICNKHMPTITHKATNGSCTVHGCIGIRPRLPKTFTTTPKKVIQISKPKTPSKTPSNLCSWEKCTRDNGQRANKSGRSKYCSIQCKNAYARHCYRLRQKGLL